MNGTEVLFLDPAVLIAAIVIWFTVIGAVLVLVSLVERIVHAAARRTTSPSVVAW